MFAGHFGAAFAAKRLAPRASLGALVLAAQWVDLLWPALLLAGVETARVSPGITAAVPLDFQSYPVSHSLATGFGWAAAFVLGARACRRTWREAAVLAGLVLSHWVLDALTHRPDLPLYPGGPKIGLGLWQSIPAAIAAEAVVSLGGLWLYFRGGTRRRGAVTVFVATLWVIQLAQFFGPPPPDMRAVAISGLAMSLLVAWAHWIDRGAGERPGVFS